MGWPWAPQTGHLGIVRPLTAYFATQPPAGTFSPPPPMSNEDPNLAPVLTQQARLFAKAKENPASADGECQKVATIHPKLFHRGAINAGKPGEPDYSCWDDKTYQKDMDKRFKFIVPQPATRPTFGYSRRYSDNFPLTRPKSATA